MNLPDPFQPTDLYRAAILHAAGYVGGELIRLLNQHPAVELVAATSRSQAGSPVWLAHPALRGTTDLKFCATEDLDTAAIDAAFICAEHGQGAEAVSDLRDQGFDGVIVDLSADHRLKDAALYEKWFGFSHPAPDRLDEAVYGLSELNADRLRGAALIANPGCFATGIGLALWPLAQPLAASPVHVTALTGASGSGGRPSVTTHFPSRDGNVRAYKVLAHQHLPEVLQALNGALDVRFVPASGPWTRGIWGTAHVGLDGRGAEDVAGWFERAYAEKPLIRLWPGELPQLLPVVGTPFCDIGWVVQEGHLVVGFALDNLLKGAASQAVQNLNLSLGLPEALGLIPSLSNELAHAWSR
ncbi:N-acetyl-gamma-glutamyl-phosphate reductase [soil metagenome]